MSCAAADNSKPKKNLLTKIFRPNHQKSNGAACGVDDSASTAPSEATTLVADHDHDNDRTMTGMSPDEQSAFTDLMTKANTMSPDEFQRYIAGRKKQEDAAQRKKSVQRVWGYSKEFLSNQKM